MVSRRLKNVLAQLEAAEIQLVAASLSYSTLLALIPFIAVCLFLLQAAGGLDIFSAKVEMLMVENFKFVIGAEAAKLVQGTLKRAASAKIGTLGAVILILSSTRLVWDMDRAFQRVFAIKHRRSIFTKVFKNGAMLLCIPFVLAMYVAVTHMKELDPIFTLFPSELRSFVGLTLLLWIVYKIIPAIKVDAISALIGAGVGSAGLMIVQDSFKFLTREVFNYSKLYGSMAAVPVLMIYVYLVWLVVLFGGGLCAAFNKKEILLK